jgi:3-oxoacyl-[acyl-carrier protein] reductase
MRLKDKVAVVTGGGSGFGEGIVKKFVAEGAQVLVVDRNFDAARRVAADMGPFAVAHQADVSRKEDVLAMIDSVEARFGPLDILINNAGVSHLPMPTEDVGEDDFDRIVAVNMKAIYLAAQVVVPRFKSRKSGVILNMAVELAPFGIRVVALNPVAGETPLLKTFMGEDTPQMRAKFLATIPIGRFSLPEDLGNAACFLCSDEASMITGVAMEVDGGRCI